jgi:hypothetical protein
MVDQQRHIRQYVWHLTPSQAHGVSSNTAIPDNGLASSVAADVLSPRVKCSVALQTDIRDTELECASCAAVLAHCVEIQDSTVEPCQQAAGNPMHISIEYTDDAATDSLDGGYPTFSSQHDDGLQSQKLDTMSLLLHERGVRLALEERVRSLVSELASCEDELRRVSETYVQLCHMAQEGIKHAQATTAAAQCSQQAAVSEANALRATQVDMASQLESLTSQLLVMTAKRNTVLLDATKAAREHVDKAERQSQIISSLEKQIADLAAHLHELDDRTDFLEPLCNRAPDLMMPNTSIPDSRTTPTGPQSRSLNPGDSDQAESKKRSSQPTESSGLANVTSTGGLTPDARKVLPKSDTTLLFSSSTEPWSLGSSGAASPALRYPSAENKSSCANLMVEACCRESHKCSSVRNIVRSMEKLGQSDRLSTPIKLTEPESGGSPSSISERNTISVGPATPHLQSPPMAENSMENLNRCSAQHLEDVLGMQNIGSESSVAWERSPSPSPSTLAINSDMRSTSLDLADSLVDIDWIAELEKDLDRLGGLPCSPGARYIPLGGLSICDRLKNSVANG